MAALSNRLIDYGTSINQVHLGVVLDSEGSDKAALTNDSQHIEGLKNFTSVVTSPNSPATLDEIEDNDEFVTFEQFDGFQVELEQDFSPPTFVLVPGPITPSPKRTTRVVDNETGEIIGSITPKPDGTYEHVIPPYTPPQLAITPLPQPGQYVIPGVGPGGIRIVDGRLITTR
jgi:hypothetical protein